MSRVEEEARAAEYRRSTQARANHDKLMEDLTLPSNDSALIQAHLDYDPLIPAAGWDPIIKTFIREEDQK